MYRWLLSPPGYLARLQRKHPPRRGDRALEIYNAFAPRLPEALTKAVRQRSIAIGTVGRGNPDVYTVHVRGGSVVVFHRSMMDFVYAVTKSLSGLVTGHTTTGIEHEQALEIEEVKNNVARLFTAWKTHQQRPSTPEQIQYPAFRLSEQAHRLAETLATAVDVFMLCHELAHAMLERNGESNTEPDADRLGFEYFVPSAAEPQIRLPLAGAFLAIRILAGLERVGVQFSNEYPPQHERVSQLWETWRRMCPSALFFDETMTIAVSFLDEMDDVDNLIEGVPRTSHSDVFRNYIRLLAQLEEVGRGRLREDALINGIEEVFKLVGLELALRLAMGAKLLEIQPKLRLELRQFFQ